ncbi:protein FAM24A [Cricetulus griseus]|uniref:Protein FAM24A n=2 Tax=Cricetulus griseus TaxID=10029 RepID=A0A061IFW1_CRIGR|nr:protein FAM24A [Cricetulus griseus]XP_027265035.1 protein FAM24A [Cricetulus griseus]ERE80682.1 protein FAM24A-like protein [Cricetulus griseus]
MFDLRTKVMIGIASSLLVAAIMLIIVVLCLYWKLAKALKMAKEADVENCIGPCKFSQSKINGVKPILAESCPAVQYCDDCSIYTDVGSLPPCFCGTSDGL